MVTKPFNWESRLGRIISGEDDDSGVSIARSFAAFERFDNQSFPWNDSVGTTFDTFTANWVYQQEAALRAQGYAVNQTAATLGIGTELWISKIDGDTKWYRVGQIDVLDGLGLDVTTQEGQASVPGEGQFDRVSPAFSASVANRVAGVDPEGANTFTDNLATERLARLAYQVRYSDFRGRLFYNPKIYSQTGANGILGSALTGKTLMVAVCYRRPHSIPVLASAPDFIVEWLGAAFCSSYKVVISNGIKYLDFAFSWRSVPYSRVEPEPVLEPGQSVVPEEPGIESNEYFPPIRNTHFTVGEQNSFQLPTVQNPRFTYQYQIAGILPAGLTESNNVISGTASATGQIVVNYPLTWLAIALDGSQTLSNSFTISVLSRGISP